METDTPAFEEIPFGSIRLRVLVGDRSAAAYGQRGWVEEIESGFPAAVHGVIAPKWIFDIGANVGAASVILRTRLPEARLLAVEPDERLIPLIEANLAATGIGGYGVRRAIVGSDVAERTSFHVNPGGTQDNRVVSAGPGWAEQAVERTTIDELTAGIPAEDGVYIKIDTQGYEPFVFAGAQRFFDRHDRWIIRTEFAPAWIRSQGGDPAALLHDLVERFDVAESPARFGFRGRFDQIMSEPLRPAEVDTFLDYVVRLNRGDRGWVDLLVCPRAKPLAAVATKPVTAAAEAKPLGSAPPAEADNRAVALQTLLTAAQVLRFALDPTLRPDVETLGRSGEHGHGLMMSLLAAEAKAGLGSLAGRRLIEIGTTREAQTRQSSTQKLALLTGILGMRFVTCDMDPLLAQRVRPVLADYNPWAEAVTALGEKYLAEVEGPIDYVYLDAFDFWHPNHNEWRQSRYREFLHTDINDEACWKMHLDCAVALVEKMTPGGIVVIDDVFGDEQSGYTGKGKTAVPYLLENGFEPILQTKSAIGLRKSTKT